MAQSNKPKPDNAADAKPVGLGELLRRAEVGTYLYLTVKDSTVSAYASGAGVKVKTERLLAIHPATREVTDITRVFIESRKGVAATPEPAKASAAPVARRARTPMQATADEPQEAPARRRAIPNLRARR